MLRQDVEAADVGKIAGAASAPQPLVEGNYQYWRDHGGEWADGYDQRKKRQVLYHIQELMLTQYIFQHAASAPTKPLKVLEFGCGVGRHLRNLAKLPDVDIYGYDQSQAMAQAIHRWSGKAWFESHVTVGLPTGKLPYPDKHFDIVYTAEVLVHVRPEHLEGILSELLRVCRGHVLHIETSEHVPLVTNEHSGCWRHDLPAAYARLGYPCEVLSSGYLAHQPFRVIVGEPARFTWVPAVIEMYRRLERDIDAGFAAMEGKASHADELVTQLTAMRAQAATAAQERETLAAEVVRVQGAHAEELVRLRAAHAGDVLLLKDGIESMKAVVQEKSEALSRAEAQHQGDLAKAGELAAKLSETTAQAEAAKAQVQGLRDRVLDIEEKGRKDRNLAAGLIEERNAFVAGVSKHLKV